MIALRLKAEENERRLVETLASELDFKLMPEQADWELEVESSETADRLSVIRNGKSAKITGRFCDLGRGLSLLHQYRQEESMAIEEKPVFAKCGVMFDASRNAVPTVESMRFYLRKMALMGLNTAMLYTEDTYQIEDEPYFGYLRGAYSYEELKAMDDYGAMLGIELLPCIQTLGHLERMLHWSTMQKYRDTMNVLLAEEETTYELIEKMIRAASKPFRSRRIHIGMDEAWDLGTGRYRRLKSRSVSEHEIMARHLARVRQILEKYGLHAMMWSDMYFRSASPSQDYYDLTVQVPPEVIAKAPADVDLVYWDYYHDDAEFYREYLQRHHQFAAKTIFAGGIWSWLGAAVDYEKSLTATVPALSECRRANIEEVFLTAWGDNGAECNLQAVLYGMQLYAEMCYTGKHDRLSLSERFLACTGAKAADFEDMSKFQKVAGVQSAQQRPVNATRTLLYQDPLLPMSEEDYRGIDTVGHYWALVERYRQIECPAELRKLFDFYAALAQAMYQTSLWHTQAAPCVRNQDRIGAQKLCALVPEITAAIESLRQVNRDLWFATNKPYGFEVLDRRFGGLLARYESAAYRMGQFAAGEISDIEELHVPKLPLYKDKNGRVIISYDWAEAASACKM